MTTQLPSRTAGTPELDSFERELLAELRSVVAQRDAAATAAEAASRQGTGRRRPRLVVATGTAAVAAFAGGSLLLGGSPAFAVDTEADGAVVVRIHELEDASGLESALTEHGIEASVDYSGHGSGLTVDEHGDVTLGGEELPADSPVAPTDAGPMDATFSNDPAGGCGLTSTGGPPVVLERDGGDYVVTLAGPTTAADSALSISTVTGPQGDTIVVRYQLGGATCGAILTR